MHDVFGSPNSAPALIVFGGEPAIVEPTEITVMVDGYSLIMREDGADVSIVVTDESGAVVVDDSHDWRSGDEPTTWRSANTGLQILDVATGDPIVTFGNSVMDAAYREQTDRFDRLDEFDPDLFLVATVDGDRWVIEDLGVSMNDANFGPDGLALNGTTLLVNIGNDWLRYDLG